MSTKRLNTFFILSATIFVAGVASRASAVYVVRDALVSVVDLGLGMAGVVRARKPGVVRGSCMARRAHTVGVAVIDAPETVSERRPEPVRRSVAG